MRSKRLVIVLVVLAVLALVADRGGQLAIERVAAGSMQDALGTPERPEVDLGGFPFLPELISQKFSDVVVDLVEADAGKIDVASVHAELTGVERRGTGIHTEGIRGEGLITYAALTAAAQESGAPVQVAFGGDGLVAIVAQVKVGGREFSAQASGRPRIENNVLIVKPERVSTSVGGAASSALVPEIRIPLRDVPRNLDIELQPGEDGVRFTFAGRNVQLASKDSTAPAG
ncbi:MAG: LmeA family phospholipid-binding protein [Sporichthyaceae bacterium]